MAKIGEVDYVARVQRCVRSLHACGLYSVILVAMPSRDPAHAPDYPFPVAYINLRSRRWNFKGAIFFRIVEAYLRSVWIFWRAKADVYVVHDVMSLGPARIVARLRRASVVYNADELEYHRNYQTKSLASSGMELIHRITERIFVPGCDLLIQADFARAEWFKQHFRLRSVDAIRNLPLRWTGARTDRLRSALGLGADDRILLYQGVQGRGRGLEIMIDCLGRLKNSHVHFVMLGPVSEHYRDEIRARAVKAQVAGNVWHLPPVPWTELLDWTASADISFALIENSCLSYYLAAPNKFYEAMMAGVPYIASDHPEMRRVYDRYPAGILIDPSNLDALTAAVARLLSDAHYYAACVKQARAACCDEYSWEAEEVRWLKLIASQVTDPVHNF